MPTRPADLRPKLEASLADWHGLFRSNVAQGQQALRRLIDGRLTLTPREDHYEFKRVGTVQPMLGGLVQELVSPTGEIWNTVFAQLESFNSLRDMSLAA